MKIAPALLVGLLAQAQLHADFQPTPFAPARGAEEKTLFTKLSPESTGLDFHNSYDDPAMWGSKYTEFQTGAVGTGLSAGDIDGDGMADLFVVSKTGSNKLFRQVTPLKFEDITETAGVAGDLESWATGSTFADIDNDGDLDLYVCYFDAPNLLYFNDGKGRFTEAAQAAGLDIHSGSVV